MISDTSSLWERATTFCEEVSKKIESGMFVSHENSVNKEYSKKFRALLAALRHDDNYELRCKILTK